jgi:hypothetical protein
MKFWIARIIATLVLGAGTAYAAPHVGFLSAGEHGHGCAVGRHSYPVGDHSKPCPTPRGCAIGLGGPVGDRSKPCPTPHGCAIGNDRFVGDRSKPCPTPRGHDNRDSRGDAGYEHSKPKHDPVKKAKPGQSHGNHAPNGATGAHSTDAPATTHGHEPDSGAAPPAHGHGPGSADANPQNQTSGGHGNGNGNGHGNGNGGG